MLKNIIIELKLLSFLLLLISCNYNTKNESLENLNLINFLIPDICNSDKNCYLKYFQSELIENYDFSSEYILVIKKDSVFVDYKVINPRNSLYNQKFILKKDRYYTYFHSVEYSKIKKIKYNIINGDYLRTTQIPHREMEANINDKSLINIKIKSNQSRLFDTIYKNMPKRAIEIKGNFKITGYQTKDKLNFIETIIEGIGTVQYVEKKGKDTTSNTILDTLFLVNREDLTSF